MSARGRSWAGAGRTRAPSPPTQPLETFPADVIIPTAMEATLLMDGDNCDCWFRDTGAGNIHYGQATDMYFKTWPRQQVLTGELPTVRKVGDYYYLLKSGLYLYWSSDKINWTICNGGEKVLAPSETASDWWNTLFNPTFEVVDGTWHLVVEGKADGEQFAVGYSSAISTGTPPDISIDWNPNLSALPIIPCAGNGDLHFIPDRAAFLLIYGDILNGLKWQIHTRTALLSDDLSLAASWKDDGFSIAKPGIHLADPSLVFVGGGKHPFKNMLIYNHDQLDGKVAYGQAGPNEFYDLVTSGQTFAYVGP